MRWGDIASGDVISRERLLSGAQQASRERGATRLTDEADQAHPLSASHPWLMEVHRASPAAHEAPSHVA